MKLSTNQIEATAATQVRTSIDRSTVDAYAEDIKDGAVFPPVAVFAEPNSERYILADGFHRLLAHVEAEVPEIEVEVKEGGLHDALKYALGANAQHGLRRSRQDKRRAVEMALKDPEISQLEREMIADLCRVHVRTVYKIQRDLNTKDEPDHEEGGENREQTKKETKQPTPPTPDDRRTNGREVTQEQVERDTLREAIQTFKSFPFGGEDTGKLELTGDDVADLEYVSTWCALAVTVNRAD